MTTLKILWQEKQDMRRVQVPAVNAALQALDCRDVPDTRSLRFRDLLDYVLLAFPEIDSTRDDVLLYYTDDDEELVRITNDVELAEAFRLMKELAVAAGRGEAAAVCKVTLVTRPLTGAAALSASGVHEVRAELVSQALEADQQKRVMALFVDLSKVVERWEPSWDHEALKHDVVSLLHEPGCQEALLEIMANDKVRCRGGWCRLVTVRGIDSGWYMMDISTRPSSRRCRRRSRRCAVVCVLLCELASESN